ncbi:MAG: hypothetical protein A3G25_05530 [Betaproteobacteria bacterium RIFCSPLOWO2_12_FULL_63_13]|nr:MAG: hypothetical protein A3G25_05530 [Betaproteobacteria bacterium RIFCSPLOWO2_12_FULL_63_13]
MGCRTTCDTFTFTQIGGSGSTVDATATTGGTSVSFTGGTPWTGVTGFTVTKQGGGAWSDIVIDNLVFSDPYAPVLSSTGVSGTTSSGTTLSSTSDQLAVAYWVELAGTGATAPSAAQVKAGLDSIGGAALASGNAPMIPAVPTDISITGLSASTGYTLCIMAEDGIPNLSSVSCVDVTTTAAADTTAPTLSGTGVSATSSSGTTLTSTSDENATGYWVVLSGTGATAPSKAQVKAGQNSTGSAGVTSGSGAMTASTPKNFSITGLSASTGYTVCLMAEDGSTNQSSVSCVAFTTTAAPDTTAPSLSGTDVSATTSTGTTLTSTMLTSTSNENATGYWIVFVAPYPLPQSSVSADQVKLGQDGLSSGSGTMTANTPTNFSIAGLSASTFSNPVYTVCLMAEDASNNKSDVSCIGVNTNVAAVPVYGACGSADRYHGSNPDNPPLWTSAPADNLCASGNPTQVTDTTSQYNWSCQGSNGGTTAVCSAKRGYSVTLAGANVTFDKTSPVTVTSDGTSFTVTPASGYVVNSVSGCSGTLGADGKTFTTGAISQNCTVTASAIIRPAGFKATATGEITSRTITAEITASGSDQGKTGTIYVAAVLPSGFAADSPLDTPDRVYLKNASGGWVKFDAANPAFYAGAVTLGQHSVDVVTGLNLSALAGTQIYLGYGIGAPDTSAVAPWNDMLKNGTFKLVHTVGGDAASLCGPASGSEPLLSAPEGNNNTSGMISVVKASANHELSSRPANAAIGGIGLTGSTHDKIASHMWLGSFTTGAGSLTITFDLGSVHNVTSIHVWNYFEFDGQTLYTTRGIKDVDVLFLGDDGSTVSSTVKTTFAEESDGLGKAYSVSGKGRFITFKVLSTYGSATWAGLSEVQFFGTPEGQLCADGATPSQVTSATDKYTWSCKSALGASAQCSAPRGYEVTLGGDRVTYDKTSPVTVASGGTTSFTVTPASGYVVNSVSGCSGTLGADGKTFTTGAISQNCTVTATANTNASASGTATGDITSKTVVGTIVASGNDQSKVGTIYVAVVLPAQYGNAVYLKNSGGTWVPYDPQNPAYFASPVTLGTITIDIAGELNLSTLIGAQVYAGYGLGTVDSGVTVPWNEMLINGRYNLIYTVK